MEKKIYVVRVTMNWGYGYEPTSYVKAFKTKEEAEKDFVEAVISHVQEVMSDGFTIDDEGFMEAINKLKFYGDDVVCPNEDGSFDYSCIDVAECKFGELVEI